MAVHLIRYGSVPILCSVFYLSLNPWEAPGWQAIAVDADVKQGITFWLQTLDSSVFTLDYEPWCQCRVNAEMAVVSLLRSDVYHLLHMCHVLIKVTISFWHECLLPYFLKVLCIYIAVWAGEFLNTRRSEWWGFCVICWQCLQWIFWSSSDFRPAMPTKFCNLPYTSITYWNLHVSCLKIFPIFCRYWCAMFFVVLLITFIVPMIYPFISVVVVSYLCVYLSCWAPTYAYSWINIYRGWISNGNTGQYRNKLFVLGCTERKLVVSFVILLFCLCCVVPLLMHYILCLITVCMKV